MGMAAWPSAVCLLTLLQPATQGMVQLRVSPVLLAECGTNVPLKCEVSSHKQGVSVKHMEWSLNGRSLCSIQENELVNHTHHQRHNRCLYSRENLSLVMHNVQLSDGGNSTYVCKLRSNRGAAQASTRVEFKEPNKCSEASSPIRGASAQTTRRNGVGSVRPIRTLWSISLFLVVLLK